MRFALLVGVVGSSTETHVRVEPTVRKTVLSGIKRTRVRYARVAVRVLDAVHSLVEDQLTHPWRRWYSSEDSERMDLTWIIVYTLDYREVFFQMAKLQQMVEHLPSPTETIAAKYLHL